VNLNIQRKSEHIKQNFIGPKFNKQENHCRVDGLKIVDLIVRKLQRLVQVPEEQLTIL